MTDMQLAMSFTEKRRNRVLAEVADRTDGGDRAVIVQAIRTVAARGVPFSSNQVRELLPVLKSNNSIGPLFAALARAGEIRKVGYVPSTAESTNGHPVAMWEAV